MRKVNSKNCSLFSYLQGACKYEIYLQPQKIEQTFGRKSKISAHNKKSNNAKNARKYAVG